MSFFAGCTKVLYIISPEKIPSIRTESRIFICWDYSHKRTKIWKSCIV